MKSSFVFLCGAVCLVQASYNPQYYGQRLQPRGGNKIAPNLRVKPTISKTKTGGVNKTRPKAGPIKDDGEEEQTSDLLRKKMKAYAKPGEPEALGAGFYAGRPHVGYTKTDGARRDGQLDPDGYTGAAIHPEKVKAKGFGPNPSGQDLRAFGFGPYTKASVNVGQGGITRLIKTGLNSETTQDLHGGQGKQKFHFESGSDEHVGLAAHVIQQSDVHPELDSVAVTAKSTPFQRSPSRT